MQFWDLVRDFLLSRGASNQPSSNFFSNRVLQDSNLATAMDYVLPGQPVKAALRLESTKSQRNKDHHLADWSSMKAAMAKARQTLENNPSILADLKSRDVVIYRTIFMEAQIRAAFSL